MVRCVKSCFVCGRRFVSCGGKHKQTRCLSCTTTSQNTVSLQDPLHENNTAYDVYKTSEVLAPLVPVAKEIACEQINPMSRPDGSDDYDDDGNYDDDDDDDESEGGDDFHCTQIIELDGNDPVEEQIAVSSTKTTTNSDVCFICGISLTKLKHRIDHIKRCSKKHGITGNDVRLVDDAVEDDRGSTSRDSAKNSENNWHGDAEKMLKLTNQKTFPIFSASAYNSQSRKIDSTIATRSLNNVLMAGSRRLETTARITKNRNDTAEPGKGNKRSRYDTRKEDWKCPLYKKITGTDFVVDGFHYAKQSLTKNYFLSHYHSDHYGGLLSRWNMGTIYCSLPTANLVSQQLRVDRKFLHPLVMNQPTIIESRGKPVTVTCLDANHCPGAVMFFFEIGRKQILHVGDFRWSRDVMLHGPLSSPLQKIASQKMELDELYLDTTYCNEKYVLPSQAKAIKATITMFENELERCKGNSLKRTLHLFGAYTIGKEKIYLSVAEHFGLIVYVDKARYRILSVVLPKECMKLLTTNKELANIWVVPMSHLNMKKMPEYFGIANSKPFAPAYDRIVGYRPTGWSITRSGIISSRNRGNLAIHSVPYSEHSSFPELVDCLACLKPAKIIPTVKASKSDEQVKVLLKGLRNRQTVMRLS